MNQQFTTTDVLRLEVETDPTGLTNLVQNPNGALGGWGWVTPTVNTTMNGGTDLAYTHFPNVASYFTTEFMPLAAGQYVAGRLEVNATVQRAITLRFDYYNSSRVFLSSSSTAPITVGTTAGTVVNVGPFLAPASTAFVMLRGDVTPGATGVPINFRFKNVTVSKAATSGALGTLRTNLVTNPSFEVNTTGWSAVIGYGATISRTTTSPFVGTGCLQMDLTADAGKARTMATVLPNTTYTVSAYAKGPAVTKIRFSVDFDSGGPVTALTSTWTRYSRTFTTTSTQTSIALDIHFTQPPGFSSPTIDAVMLEQGSTLGTYFDGSTAAAGGFTYAWTGTAHASTSTATSSNLAFVEPVSYLNILGPTHDIKVNRESLNVGTLSATILDSTLDPSQSALIRPGRKCRLMATRTSYTTTQTIVETRRNLIINPSIEVNTTGWSGSGSSGVATISRSTAQAAVGTSSLAIAANVSGTSVGARAFCSSFAVVAGTTYTFQFKIRSAATSRNVNVAILWNGGASVSGSLTSSIGTTTTSGWTVFSLTAAAPAGTTTAYVEFGVRAAAGTLAAGEVHYVDAMMFEAASSVGTYFDGDTADIPGVIGTPGVRYDWTGTAHASASTLSTDTLTTTLVGTGMDTLFQGTVSGARVNYDLLAPKAQKRARIELTAVDNLAALSNQKRPEGVTEIADLPYVLEGCGVPWNVNGSGNQVPSATVVSYNDNASAVDQIAVTRDSNLGYAWVDRYGIAQVWDSALTFGSAITLAETDYSNIDIDYDMARCINEVNLKFLRYNPTTGSTEEVPYGPYRNETSISQWGVRSATFTIQGIAEETADLLLFANSVLAANATPQIKANSLTFAITSLTDFQGSKPFIDLYDRATVNNSVSGNFTGLRVTRVEHSITPDKWLVRLGFESGSAVASPTFVPSPTTGAGGKTIGELLRPVGEITMFYGSTIPAGWLKCDGSAIPAQYADLIALVGANTPNFTDRFPIGAGTKAVGTSGGNPTVTLSIPNLPPHTHTGISGHTSPYAGGGSNAVHFGADPPTHPNYFGVGTTGSGTAVDILNPWRAVNFIIRAV